MSCACERRRPKRRRLPAKKRRVATIRAATASQKAKMERAFRADLQARKAQIQALATQISHLRNKASSTSFPAERDTLIRVADQQTRKMVALQTELAHLTPRANPLPPLALAGLWACAAAAMAGGIYLIATSFKTKINEPVPLPNFTPQGPVTILV